jgi:hypothetical protein
MARDPSQRMADEQAIRDLIVRIAMVRSFGTPDEYAALFTPDARWERVPGPEGQPNINGIEEEIARAHANQAAGLSGPGSHAHHSIPMTLAEVNGDCATAVSQLLYVTNADTSPTIAKMWILRDDLVRTPDGWRVCHRRLQRP